MDPFTIALATFGVQKLRGKSTNRALRDAVLAGGIGQLGGMAGMGGLQAFGQSAPIANRLDRKYFWATVWSNCYYARFRIFVSTTRR
jgi:hypothetical protein